MKIDDDAICKMKHGEVVIGCVVAMSWSSALILAMMQNKAAVIYMLIRIEEIEGFKFEI